MEKLLLELKEKLTATEQRARDAEKEGNAQRDTIVRLRAELMDAERERDEARAEVGFVLRRAESEAAALSASQAREKVAHDWRNRIEEELECGYWTHDGAHCGKCMRCLLEKSQAQVRELRKACGEALATLTEAAKARGGPSFVGVWDLIHKGVAQLNAALAQAPPQVAQNKNNDE